METKGSVDLKRYEWVHGREEEGGGYYAYIPELPGCMAVGETLEEAFRNLEEIGNEWIQAELEAGREIPPPFDLDAYSGKFALRMPVGLHQQAAKMAEREKTSLNKYIVTAIAARVGADDLFDRMIRKLGTYQVNNIYLQTYSGEVPTSVSPPFLKIPRHGKSVESDARTLLIPG